jgi:hypothetical protein
MTFDPIMGEKSLIQSGKSTGRICLMAVAGLSLFIGDRIAGPP